MYLVDQLLAGFFCSQLRWRRWSWGQLHLLHFLNPLSAMLKQLLIFCTLRCSVYNGPRAHVLVTLVALRFGYDEVVRFARKPRLATFEMEQRAVLGRWRRQLDAAVCATCCLRCSSSRQSFHPG